MLNNNNFTSAVDKMTYWSKLFGVITLVMSVIVFIGGIMALTSDILDASGMGGTLGVSYIIGALLYLYPGMLFLRFSKHTRAALNDGNKEQMAEGFENMGKLFTFSGVLTIIALVLYVLGIALFAGTAAMI